MSDQFLSHPSHQAKFPVNRGFNWVEPTTMLKPPKSGNCYGISLYFCDVFLPQGIYEALFLPHRGHSWQRLLIGYKSWQISDPLLRKAISLWKTTRDVESLLVMTCDEVQQRKSWTKLFCKYDKDQKMCLLWQSVHPEQWNAEVLLRGMCHSSERSKKEKAAGLPSGSWACNGTSAAGVPYLF